MKKYLLGPLDRYTKVFVIPRMNCQTKPL